MRRRDALLLLLVAAAAWAPGATAKRASTTKAKAWKLRGGLDAKPGNLAEDHEDGPAALRWLHDHAQVIPRLLRQQWPSSLVIGYTTGYDFEKLKPLIYGFLGNVAPPALLVLLSDQDSIPGMPPGLTDRVLVQQHAFPTGLGPEALPHAVSLRFYVASAFLGLTRHNGSVLWLDTRDVFLQRDVFASQAALSREARGRLVFPRESSAYRIRGPYTDNAAWLLACYGPETMRAIGGMYVLNSGTLLGPGQRLRAYFWLLTKEFERRWHCRRSHGADQAMHNYVVYTGRLIGTHLEFSLEDQITGRFAFIAYTHPAVWDMRDVSDSRAEMHNREGQAYAVIHLWPGDNPVAKRVVLPYVAEFERCLAAKAAGQPHALCAHT